MNRVNWISLGCGVALILFLALFSSFSPLYIGDEEAVTTRTERTTAPTGLSTGSSTLFASPGAKSRIRGSIVPKEAPPLSPNLTVSLAKLQSALVNITCSVTEARGLFLVSGTGVFIDSRGIVLTNAHVAQFLLESNDMESSCVIRTGSPATAAYTAKALYVSKAWLKNYPGTALSGTPSGTGEYDFALLAITGSSTPLPLPSSFPSVSLQESTPQKGQRVAVGSYGAQGMSAEQVRYGLYPTLAFGSIEDVFSFKKTTDLSAIDLIRLGENRAAQSGSSGGGIMDEDGNLIALITTSAPGKNVSAITARHIYQSFRKEAAVDLETYLSENLPRLLAQVR